MEKFDVIIIGGGAGGFFTAINIAEEFPQKRIIILEKAKEGLLKVKASGGGRCNLTNAEPEVSNFVKNYPRGEKELLSPMLFFGSTQTMQWFNQRGVALKTEADGRVFPQADTSQAVINCFLGLTKKYGVQVAYGQGVKAIKKEGNLWQVTTATHSFLAEKLVIATGSNEKMWQILQGLGHSIVQGVPSLFSFCTTTNFITNLAGTTMQVGLLLEPFQGGNFKNKNLKTPVQGAMLVTHSGFSGPAVLRLSALAARELYECNYECNIVINWLSAQNVRNVEEAFVLLQNHKKQHLYKEIGNAPPQGFTKKIWFRILEQLKIENYTLWHDFSNAQMRLLSAWLVRTVFPLSGKATFKEEFVTAGGVSLKEVNFKTYASKKLENVFFTGEVLNVDAVTGGFNFQNAWSGGYIIAKHIFN